MSFYPFGLSQWNTGRNPPNGLLQVFPKKRGFPTFQKKVPAVINQ